MFFYNDTYNAIETIYRYNSENGLDWLTYADITLNDEVEIIDYINTKEE